MQTQKAVVEASISLKECFDAFCKKSFMDGDNQWYCEKCDEFVDINKKMDIYRSPNILVISLKRFKDVLDQRGRAVSIKNDTQMDIPLDLDISDYVYSAKDKKSKSKKE